MTATVRMWQAAYQAGEDEVCLSASGRSYSVDYNSMQQVNEDTGTSRPVQRKVNPLSVGSFSRNAPGWYCCWSEGRAFLTCLLHWCDAFLYTHL